MIQRKIKAVLFDLDDTLYDQMEYLDRAFMLVCKYLEYRLGVSSELAFSIIKNIVKTYGSGSGRTFDMLLKEIGYNPDKSLVRDMISVFYSYKPEILTPYPGVYDTLSALKEKGYLIGVITDGYPEIQRAKIKALRIEKFLDVTVISDEYGREFRKPHTLPYEVALKQLGINPSEAVYVGDSPFKDFYGANKLGIITIRVKTGEYRALTSDNFDYNYRPKYEISIISEILDILKLIEER